MSHTAKNNNNNLDELKAKKRRGRTKTAPEQGDAHHHIRMMEEEQHLGGEGGPSEARLVALVLRSLGVRQWEAGVVPQLVEFVHRYARDVLLDAQVFCAHSHNTSTEDGAVGAALGLDDVRLAIQCRVNYSFTQPPPREFLLELAQTKNCLPLPFMPSPSLFASESGHNQRSSVVLPPAHLRVQPLFSPSSSSSSLSSFPSSHC